MVAGAIRSRLLRIVARREVTTLYSGDIVDYNTRAVHPRNGWLGHAVPRGEGCPRPGGDVGRRRACYDPLCTSLSMTCMGEQGAGRAAESGEEPGSIGLGHSPLVRIL